MIAQKHNSDWWRGAVIYQIYPRSFQDSTGNGIGDLQGITSRLPYVADLGVDAIWLSPIFTSPMLDMGYDVSDYCDIDPLFGTLKDFDVLVERAHSLGLKVMIDQVLSHTSDQHKWFAESRQDKTNPKADWYVWADAKQDGTPPNNWQSVFGGSAWTWDTRRCQYYLHNFLTSQPDLNFHNAEVQNALLKTTQFWLERGVDGFRLDTVNFYFHDQELRNNPPSKGKAAGMPETNPYGFQEHIYDKTRPENIGFLKRFRALLDEYPNTTAVGEVGDETRAMQTMAEYTAGNDMLHMCYSFEMLGSAFSADHFKSTIENFESASNTITEGQSWPCWAFSNHDVMRHVSRWAQTDIEQEAIAKLSISLLLALKGSICIYQGEELGLPEAELEFDEITDPYGKAFWPKFKGRDGCRTPMVWDGTEPNAGFSNGAKTWLPVKPDHVAKNSEAQQDDAASVLAHYKSGLSLRKNHNALQKGELTFCDIPDDESTLAFHRHDASEKLICIFNLSRSSVDHKVSSLLDSQCIVRSSNVTLDGTQLKLGPLGYIIAKCRS